MIYCTSCPDLLVLQNFQKAVTDIYYVNARTASEMFWQTQETQKATTKINLWQPATSVRQYELSSINIVAIDVHSAPVLSFIIKI